MCGFLIAAPSSGSGKTTFTLALLRFLKRQGIPLSSGKAGPDFIDPAFHSVASGKVCVNFDPWGMRESTLLKLNQAATQDGKTLIVESMMGLFDGAADGSGSSADLAQLLDLKVIFVVDCSKLSHSIAAILHGFKSLKPELEFAGVVLNKVGSLRHEKMLRDALSVTNLNVLAVMYRDPDLEIPERHLGLVQASEHAEIEAFIEGAADKLSKNLDIDLLNSEFGSLQDSVQTPAKVGDFADIEPLGHKIAVARDIAFAFSYPHLLDGWRKAGSDITFFSPLADECPQNDCDAIFLPGGYPELYAKRLSKCYSFKDAVIEAAQQGKTIFGECGGYMVLGNAIIDREGDRYEMLGLLPLVTSFADKERHLGYRRLLPQKGAPWRKAINAHEFHYTSLVEYGEAAPLFNAYDALGEDLGMVGMIKGNVLGSYMHVIDVAD